MPKKPRRQQEAQNDTDKLKNRLEETEETLRAIQDHMVDAFVVTLKNGVEVVTLHGSEIPYRTMVESMNEGAVTLIPDGTIFYCNGRLGEMLETDCEKLIGIPFHTLLASEEQNRFQEIYRGAVSQSVREEFTLQTANGNRKPVQLSIYRLGEDEMNPISVLVTDISDRVQSEEKIRSLAAELTRVEQEERHRISQVLHDDLQQRLFAVKAQLAFLKDVNLSADTYRELDEIQASLSESIAITRNLSIDLSPIVLQGEGLAEAIIWLAFRMKEQYSLHIDVDAKSDFNHLDQQFRTLLFQSIRELLFNVVKHAGILEATVTLEQVNGHGRITVDDHGRGFDVDAVMRDDKAAHGLFIIRDRLKLMGCPMEIQSQSGHGTQLVIDIPQERSPA